MVLAQQIAQGPELANARIKDLPPGPRSTLEQTGAGSAIHGAVARAEESAKALRRFWKNARPISVRGLGTDEINSTGSKKVMTANQDRA